jgi:hypothetical protein
MAAMHAQMLAKQQQQQQLVTWMLISLILQMPLDALMMRVMWQQMERQVRSKCLCRGG